MENILDHIDVLLFFGIIILTFILLYEYILLPYGIFWKTGFRCLISFFAAIIFSYIVILFLETDSEIPTMVSKIVEIEVTVGILVISLSIVIIQQIASSYLPAIGKLFTNYRTNPIFLITSFLYLASILSGIWLLIQTPDIPTKHMLYIFFLISISAFVSTIISFIPNVFNFLLPKNVIKLLHENRKSNTFSIKDENCMHILGILLNSLEKYDYDAVKECFNCVEVYKSELINSYKNNIVPRELDSYFALEKSLISVANYFITIGELSLKVGYNDCTMKVIQNLYDVREVADEHKMESVISLTTKSIKEFSKEVVYPLITELNDKNPDIHKYAVFALGEVGDERALSPIVKLLKNEDYTNKSALMCTFISALMKINPGYIIKFLLEVVENRSFNKNELINKVFFAYRKKELLSRKLLVRLLKYNEPYIKGFAALGLGEVGDEDDIGALLCLLLDTEQPSYVRGKAASAIGTINDRYLLNKSTIYKLFERMSDLDPYVRYNAVYSLSKIKIEDSRIISKIEDLLLNDPDPYVRDSAVFALKEGNYSCSIESLNNALKKEKEENIRFNIILALGFIRGFNKIGPLLKYYFPQMSLPLYNLVCNSHFLDDERSSILPLYAAAFCTKSKYYGPNSRSKAFHDL